MITVGDERPLRVGVIGLGFGCDVHVPVFRSLAKVEVVALLGRDPERTETVGQLVGVDATTSREAFLSRDLDAVSIAVPPDAVEALVGMCLERGLSVLCEKPLGPDTATAARLLDKARAAVTALNFQFAELETFCMLQELIKSDCLGTVKHAQLSWLSESRAHRAGQWSWKMDAERHGGVLNLFGTHAFYLAELLMGPIVRLSARLESRTTSALRPQVSLRAAEDLALVTVEHASGSVTSLMIGNANPAVEQHRWTVVGSNGSAILDNSSQDHIGGFSLSAKTRNGEILANMVEPRSEADSRLRPCRKLAARFVASVRSKESCTPSFFDGARVQTVVDAIRQADSERRWIDVPSVSK